jgi:GT2 family glycosyltransferase
MDLSISIVNWNTRDLLDQCLASIYETTHGIEFEVIVVDNASEDGSADMVASKYPSARLIANRNNIGFPAANNQAYRESKGRFFLLLNPDTICLPNTLQRLVSFLDSNPSVGAVGPLVLNADKTLQQSWARFPTLWTEVRGVLVRKIGDKGVCPMTADEVRRIGPFRTDWVGGCCFMIRRSAVEQIGLMDESLFMYCEETDWCKRLAQRGWEVWLEPSSEIIHLGGQSSQQVSARASAQLRKSKVAYFRKYHGVLQALLLQFALALKWRAKQTLGRHGP